MPRPRGCRAGGCTWKADGDPADRRLHLIGNAELRPFDFTRAMVRTPGATSSAGLRAGGGPEPHAGRRVRRTRRLCRGAAAAGLAVTVPEPLEDFPDAIFVEDPALVFPEAAILLRPGAPSRIGEAARLRRRARSGLPASARARPRPCRWRRRAGHARPRVHRPVCPHRPAKARPKSRELAGVRLGRTAVIAETPQSVLHLKTASSIIDAETCSPPPIWPPQGCMQATGC